MPRRAVPDGWRLTCLSLKRDNEELMPLAEQLFFGWKQEVRKYRKIMPLNVK
jgi:hypothetical protein